MILNGLYEVITTSPFKTLYNSGNELSQNYQESTIDSMVGDYASAKQKRGELGLDLLSYALEVGAINKVLNKGEIIPSTNTKPDIISSSTHITIKKDGKNIDIPKSDTFNDLKPTQRGIEIENNLANTEYKDLFHIGKENNGYFPLIDFVNEKTNTAISLKSVDTRGKTWVDRMENHIEDLANRGVTIDGKLANMTLDIRVQHGGLSDPRINDLEKFAENIGVKLIVKEFK